MSEPAHVLPVVMVRDPYFWMQSMCRNNYAIKWQRDELHCPNLVPTQHNYHKGLRNQSSIPVKWGSWGEWDSLAHYWNWWNRQYYQIKDTYPHIFVRFEDMLFYPSKVTELICKCAGGQPRWDSNFTYESNNIKAGRHDNKSDTSMVKAMIRYGQKRNRIKGFMKEDLQYVMDFIDMDMMKLFHYSTESPGNAAAGNFSS